MERITSSEKAQQIYKRSPTKLFILFVCRGTSIENFFNGINILGLIFVFIASIQVFHM